MNELIKKWYEAKCEEVTWRAIRRHAEDELFRLTNERHFEIEQGTLKIIRRKKYDIDQYLLHDLATAHGLERDYDRIFSWSISIKEGEWEKSQQRTRDFLSPAIRIKESRPTFNFNEKE